MTQTQTPPNTVPAELKQQVTAWRRYLHQHPELSFQEHQTADYVEGELKKLPHLTLSRPTPTSILAVLKGTAGAGRTVLLRADMDALPIQEDTGLEFASQNPGVMHACGHDGHTAMLLGAATLLSASPETLRGEVRFIFQHAEELFPGGAQQVVDAGIMDGVDAVVGTHLMTPIPTGVIVLRDGPLLAASDVFNIRIEGKGGHAASPHETIDPVVIAAQIVLALQSVVSRQRDPLDPAVLSVTQINGGSAHNIIPGSVTMTGTVRTFDAELREKMPERMEKLIKGITEGYGANYTFDYEKGYRAVINDPEITEMLREVTRQTLGAEATLSEGRPIMGGEDFSAYLTKAPGTFIAIGAGGPDYAPHHHSKFTVDERALEHGVLLYVGAARRLTQAG
ncbi:amidohydrolase [Deinococcus psychrotolerans]|uniref:Amidohydrolase n=1 Tax=Deinococcus psychrotolerans TaxID=2489213 RepID=A0A3G8Y9L6_9DEIO|nr:M20 family metallopeptidase [Deinococcus psychrotolerans]AZI41603.1 amidohydrolase [Deinococcus psychrotolerans]